MSVVESQSIVTQLGRIYLRGRNAMYVSIDETFEPTNFRDWNPTHHSPGSRQKVEVLATRVQLGQPLWHPQDKTNFEGVRELEYWRKS